VRTEATGYGVAYFAERMMAAQGDNLEGKTCVVSGAGNVAIFAIEKIQQLGGTVVACSDSSGYVVDREGIDLATLKAVKFGDRARIGVYADRRVHASLATGGSIWDVPCDLAVPCATQNELTARDAKTLVSNGVIAVVEGANMPSTPEAVEILVDAGVAFGPGQAANAGGVATSALEMQQNASRDSWSFEYTERRLAQTVADIHDTCRETADEYATPGNYLVGANIAGFLRVSQAMVALGLI
jgi:glutamate dehydrogenase (NADP+)